MFKEVSYYFSPKNLLTLENKPFLNAPDNLGFLIMGSEKETLWLSLV